MKKRVRQREISLGLKIIFASILIAVFVLYFYDARESSLSPSSSVGYTSTSAGQGFSGYRCVNPGSDGRRMYYQNGIAVRRRGVGYNCAPEEICYNVDGRGYCQRKINTDIEGLRFLLQCEESSGDILLGLREECLPVNYYGDRIIDERDLKIFSLSFQPYPDSDGDGDADLADLLDLQLCSSGLGSRCEMFDLNNDSTIDMYDELVFEILYSRGDFNRNGYIDVHDYVHILSCFRTGSDFIVVGNRKFPSVESCKNTDLNLNNLIAGDRMDFDVFGQVIRERIDFDSDGGFYPNDRIILRLCFSGRGVPSRAECKNVDVDHDGDVDREDYDNILEMNYILDKVDRHDSSPDCNDGRDNDDDGNIDYPQDKGCDALADIKEYGEVKLCDDGIDNDNDGRIDFPDDSDCSDFYSDSEGVIQQCEDGIDNDRDGSVDYPSDVGCFDNDDRSEGDVIDAPCFELYRGHNDRNAKRINVVFIGYGYDKPQDLLLRVRDQVDAMMGLEPFKRYGNRFNFWVVKNVGLLDRCEVAPSFWGDSLRCPTDSVDLCKIKTEEPYINEIYINEVINSAEDYRSRASFSGRVFIYGRDLTEPYLFAHEFGHSFGKLQDEYTERGGPWSEILDFENLPNPLPLYGPNCYSTIFEDTTYKQCFANAPWRSLFGNGCGVPGIIDCTEDDPDYAYEVSCHEGCFYFGKGAFRPSLCSLMGNHRNTCGGVIRYGLVNELELERKILELTS